MYTPLYLKTNYSFLESLVKIDDLIKTCVNYGIKSVAITDNNMIGVYYFYKKCIDNDIKPIIGLETKYKDEDLVLLAKDFTGYQDLIRINLEGFTTYEELSEFKDNLVIILPFSSSNYYEELKDLGTYLGFSSLDEETEATKISSNTILFNKVLYVTKEESKYFKYALMMKEKKNVLDDVTYEDHNNFLINPKDIEKYAKYYDNTNFVANLCNVKIEKKDNLIPTYSNNLGVSSKDYLTSLSMKGLEIRLGKEPSDKYKERLTYELDVINKMGFSDYFLITYDYVKYAKKSGILIGPGRGSAGGSLVAYSLGIIDIDPLEYDLIFERFLNPYRVTMPDIDVDFPDTYRDEVKQYVKEKYGEKKVAGVVAVGSLKAKAVLDDVGKILRIPEDKLSRLKRFITDPKDKLKDIYDKKEDFRLIVDNDDRLKLLYEVSLYFENYPKNITVHASGLIISKEDLDTLIPIIKEENMYISSYEGNYLEELGLLKMDFLGNKNLTIIMDTIKYVKEYENIDIDFLKIPLDDKEAIKIFYDINTNGIFQFESNVMKNLLSKLKVENFSDIVAAISLVRPGPDTKTYLERRNNNIKVEYLNKDIENILGSTYGVLVYQEQVMSIARVVAGFSMAEADNLRRAMGKKKKEELASWKDKFVSGAIKNGYDYDYAIKTYEDILEFAGYGFNKSHAVAYSIISYKMAYLKAHYPKYFFLSLLSMTIGSDAKTSTSIREAKRVVNFKLPDINKSTDKFEIDKDGLIFPLSNIKNIGGANAKKIVEVRGEGFEDIFDALIKLTDTGINKNVLENLILSGCFSSFGYNRNTIMTNLDNLLNYAFIAKGIERNILEKPEIEVVEEYSKDYLLNLEKELFGFYISYHPTNKYKADYQVIDLIDAKNYQDRVIDTICLVERVKIYQDKNGNNMAFVYGNDETGDMDYVFFSKIYSDHHINKNDILLIRGKVEQKQKINIIVEKVKILT